MVYDLVGIPVPQFNVYSNYNGKPFSSSLPNLSLLLTDAGATTVSRCLSLPDIKSLLCYLIRALDTGATRFSYLTLLHGWLLEGGANVRNQYNIHTAHSSTLLFLISRMERTRFSCNWDVSYHLCKRQTQ